MGNIFFVYEPGLLTDHQRTKLLWNNSASISKLLI